MNKTKMRIDLEEKNRREHALVIRKSDCFDATIRFESEQETMNNMRCTMYVQHIIVGTHVQHI